MYYVLQRGAKKNVHFYVINVINILFARLIGTYGKLFILGI